MAANGANGPSPNGTTGAHANGASHSRPLKPGIYAPIPSFFLPESEDLGTFVCHYMYMR